LEKNERLMIKAKIGELERKNWMGRNGKKALWTSDRNVDILFLVDYI
jgi:hypothetical protein